MARCWASTMRIGSGLSQRNYTAPRPNTLSGTLFVELVSQYSMSTEGYFKTFPVAHQGFEIVLNKKVIVMESMGVQLFIPSVMAKL